ncbi:putative Fe-S oxidoreductase [Caldisphaera lagunensis DSM 15908]|uniref:Putative Fe-S oxidoreductase n=1 Tax=Caldisphaera lagunensis (strain DSM 15908 / JCM 11604 / ANMR 0165 / IC-154) TaxID=1056495 RepID=L0A9B1_CALLD|nr:radical SAM protein [Caldisphaera lagunensis]AFZ70461.1 putative Fe-S oxidoreductase [Caldisphaera lagunensis DSM 15908]
MKCNAKIEKISNFYGRPIYYINKPIPLIGHIAFGIIDRGTNVLQVRPSTLCFHNCIFCSVDAGPNSKFRESEYIVNEEWLAEWVNDVANVKNEDIEVLIDGVGEPISHPKILKLISLIKKIKNVKTISIETHGGSLSLQLAKKLEEAGLNRINLSIDSINSENAKKLSGTEWYDVNKILKNASEILKETNIDIVLTPVVIPEINEKDMDLIIEWAKENHAGEKSNYPSGILIQKFEIHHFGRKPEKIKVWSWGKFYSWLKILQEKHNYRLIVKPEELGFKDSAKLEKPFHVNDIVKSTIIGNGWLKNEYLATDENCIRIISIISKEDLMIGSKVKTKIIRDKDNIFLGKLY